MDPSDRLEFFRSPKKIVVRDRVLRGSCWRVTAGTRRLRTPAVHAGKAWPHIYSAASTTNTTTPGPGDISGRRHRWGMVLDAEPGAGAAGCHGTSDQPVLHSVPRSGWPGHVLGHSRRPRFHEHDLASDAGPIHTERESFWRDTRGGHAFVPGHSDAGRIGCDGPLPPHLRSRTGGIETPHR